ncbi:MAG TPA: hypothetical protein VMR88_15865 [Candidatus Polarisedimenticolaceae bacterium]|jgi:hypothetical protein|nr:hypothetical protein [Candidatus Polarisedimenticolaceae bacterium]
MKHIKIACMLMLFLIALRAGIATAGSLNFELSPAPLISSSSHSGEPFCFQANTNAQLPLK